MFDPIMELGSLITTPWAFAGNHGIQEVTGLKNSRSVYFLIIGTSGHVMSVWQVALQINAKHSGPDRLKCAPGSIRPR
ncbi:hypothetical protein [Pseudomonas viridiflava]|uniref:hypothetical protein n=1 Tax=Pseudomonas viridiflava TaxID=33069 RepID=UPI000F011456|nr:hypothetical protein [Pseudomonas viridiflava]